MEYHQGIEQSGTFFGNPRKELFWEYEDGSMVFKLKQEKTIKS